MSQEQIPIVHEIATQYWHKRKDQVDDDLESIKILKNIKGKIVGIIPQYGEFPPAFFKIYFNERGFQNEVTGLMAASSLPPIKNISIPRIIKVIPDQRAILIEKLTWRDTDAEVRRFFVNSLHFNWRIIGSWLRSFHDSKIASFVNNDYLNNKIKKNDSVLIKLQHLFSADQLKVIHSILLSGQEYFANHLIECVISHGDFGLDHIKLSKSNTYIIDFEDLQLAPREFDILFLLTNLEYTNYFPQRRGLHKKICNEFLEGYGMQLPVTPLNDLLYLSIKLNILERYQRLMKNYPVPGYKKYVYYYFLNEGMKRLAKWLDTIKCEMKESYFI